MHRCIKMVIIVSTEGLTGKQNMCKSDVYFASKPL